MSIEIIEGCTIYRHFMYQVDVNDLEEVIKDEINFVDHPFGKGALLYDATLKEPLLCGARSVAYLLTDLNSLFPKKGVRLACVEVRDPKPTTVRHNIPLGIAASIICPLGDFDQGQIEIEGKRVNICGGDAVVIPDRRVGFNLLPARSGKMMLMIAHGTRKG